MEQHVKATVYEQFKDLNSSPDMQGYRNNLGIIFHQNIYCDPLLEPPCQGGSDEGVTIYVFTEK